MTDEEKVKLIALYFPQFHRIPENDRWWGDGFTDWTNVKKAKPQFEGHNQPRVPKDGRYYDQSKVETIRWQVALAKAHGVYGFCHYHYWFDGKQLLEAPTNAMLDHPDIDFPFCLAWANETWSRRWDGRESDVLISQTHPPVEERWEQHFQYLIRAWKDPRAIKMDGKPVFLIYRPHLVTNLAGMLDYWRKRAMESGLPGLFIVAIKQFEYPKPGLLKCMDGSMHFQPFEAMDSPDYRPLPEPVVPEMPDTQAIQAPAHHNETTATYPVESLGFAKRQWKKLPSGFRRQVHKVRWAAGTFVLETIDSIAKVLPELIKKLEKLVSSEKPLSILIWDYESVWTQVVKVEQDFGVTTFPGAFVDWDNTPRYGTRARLFKGASPGRFKYWFERLVHVTASRPVKERFIFINAWNEWAEGTYLEPDEKHGMQHLEIVRDALQRVNGGEKA